MGTCRNDSNPGVRLVGKHVCDKEILSAQETQTRSHDEYTDPGLALPGRRLQAGQRDEKAQLGLFIKGALMAISHRL